MRESNQAFFNDSGLLAVDEAMIEVLKRRAREAPLRRFRLCLHASADETLQEMIVVHGRGNYSRPHAHPVPSTTTILDGALTMFLFDEDGNCTQTIEMGPRGSSKPFCLRIGPSVWHMPVCRTPQVVFYETTVGPFVRDQMNLWAPWSPAEDDAAGIERFLQDYL